MMTLKEIFSKTYKVDEKEPLRIIVKQLTKNANGYRQSGWWNFLGKKADHIVGHLEPY